MGQVIKFPKNRQLRVLICDQEPAIVDLLTELIKAEFGDRYPLKVISTYHGDEALALSHKHPIGIFILTLNNIVFAPLDQSAEQRIKKAVDLMRNLKSKYKRPVIALYGWPDYPSFEVEVKLTGADHVIKVPFEIDPFMGAVQSCLEMIEGRV